MLKTIKQFFVILVLTLVSCSDKTPVSNYTPVKEITDSYDLDGNETLVTKNIPMLPKPFINTLTNDTVKIIHSLDNTSFHFYNTVAFKTKKEGVIVGGSGLRIRTTIDGGLHWRENRFSKFSNAFHSVSFNKENIFAVGESSNIYKSSDFGQHWEVLDTDKLINNFLGNEEKEYPKKYSSRYYKIKFYNNTGIITGDYNKAVKSKPIILKTTDAGQNWTKLKTIGIKNDESGISDFVMLSEKILLIVTFQGSCYKSIDGGANWELLFNDDILSLNSIDFINEEEGYIGGMSSTLLHTENGGETWQPIDLGLDKYLNVTNISFINNQKAVMTIASQNGELEAGLLYGIDTKTKVLKSLLSKKDTTVVFKGESYGLYRLDNVTYVLDRNNLYKLNQ